MRLAELPLGRPARVVDVEATHDVVHRLMEMGLTRGAEVVVRKIAPLGDPIEIEVRRGRLSIRRVEAASILVDGGS